MISRRAAVAAAVVSLLVGPLYAAAGGIVPPGVTEEVVEGHTVFTVLQKSKESQRREESAAVAVLVREREIARQRFNGTLWFMDKYLTRVKKSQSEFTRYPCGGAILAVNHNDPDPRTMLLSYNSTDQLQQRSNVSGDPHDTQSETGDYSLLGLDPRRGDPTVGAGTIGQPPLRPGAVPNPSGAAQPERNSWLDVNDPDGSLASTSATNGTNPVVSTSTLTSLQYNESYLVTDPNDHTWIIDKYDAITVASLDLNGADLVLTTQRFPVWVVNLLGKPVFVPDDGLTSCSPAVDDPWQQSLINKRFLHADRTVCNTTKYQDAAGTYPNVCPHEPDGIFAPAAPSPPYNDDDFDGISDGQDARPPAIGYYEPTDADSDGDGVADRGSYCYDGNAPTPYYDTDGDGVRETPPPPGGGCDHALTGVPPFPGYIGPRVGVFGNGAYDPIGRRSPHVLRMYNALLYFHLGEWDVRVQGRAPHGAFDTNGCQAGTEWECPDVDGDGFPDDDAEGNSHPFNPPGVWVPHVHNPTTAAPIGDDPATPPNEGPPGQHVDVWAFNRDCSTGHEPGTDHCRHGFIDANDPSYGAAEDEHVAHNRGLIDLYFSPTARPMEPAVRIFAELDYEGRTQAFHENEDVDPADPHCAVAPASCAPDPATGHRSDFP